MNVRLNINGTDVGFSRELPVSINKSVADIREPGKRNSGYSKTLKIPGSPEINKLFEFIFQVNVESNNFNPNLKTPASYFVNELQVFKGSLQLLQINKTYSGLQEVVEYECSIVAENGNLFLDIAGLYLTDLDLSDLDHEFTYASGLFNPTLGEGYCYPYIDYGVSTFGNRVGRLWTFEHLKPAVFEREYVRRIFENAGYSWFASGFLDSDYYRHIIIPDVNAGALQIPADIAQDNQFLGVETSLNSNNQSGSYSLGWHYTNLQEVAVFTDDSTNGFDPGGVYDNATGVFTAAINATYTISTQINFQVSVNPPAGTVNVAISGTIVVKLQKSTDGGGSWGTILSTSQGIDLLSTAVATPSITVTYPPTLVTMPAKFRVVVESNNFAGIFTDGASNNISSGTSSLDVNYTGNFGAVLTTGNLSSGSTVEMNATIPRDVTQLDFITGIIRAENLYIEQSNEFPNKYVVEPREDFIQTDDPLDWTDKLDRSKDITITPMGELDVKRYIFRYRSDKDYYNKIYEEEFKEVYGTETVDVQTDFVKGEKIIELPFSATPSASAADLQPSVNIVAPRLLSMDESGNVTPMKCNIRRLYWAGLIPCDSHDLIPDGYFDQVTSSYTGSSPLRLEEYPFAGHVDDPFNPTIDLNFDNALRIYWTFPNQTFTNNGRYGERYSKFISEITDRDSKIVTAYFFLTEHDIYNFSFRKQIFFDGTYYFVNEIKDYDPQEDKSIPVELLKLQTGPTFTPYVLQTVNDQIGGGDMNNARTGPNMNMRGNYGTGQSFGYNNINNDPIALVIGNNNLIE